ncbi:hypothetical protein V6N13_117490 [Hibiscus sabdariffa]|uniref:Uncharacterized protein n=1 Tax=Hibiscus sabdariffa TaxID=183260 RepID=A0ABR2PBH0_9ROSI
MTAPVITEVLSSDGPFYESSFSVSFYVPKVNRANPPPTEGLHLRRWKSTYVAIRQFGGFVTVYNIAGEVAALQASLEGTVWTAAIEKARKDDATSVYSVAQYNDPFEFSGRVNEIWMLFDLEDEFLLVKVQNNSASFLELQVTGKYIYTCICMDCVT